MDNRNQQAWLDQLPRLSREFFERYQRPFVIVSYAQSLDGSIATRDREPLRLSGEQSMLMTHRIRAASDAILIGINTLVIDNPRLTVRLVEGTDPQPIVLDSSLRIPLQAQLLERTDLPCWVACSERTDLERVRVVEGRGAKVIRCNRDLLGRVELGHLLQQLGQRGIRSIMVEGGSQVITSFLEARLVDQVIITIAPRLVGGLPVLCRHIVGATSQLELDSATYESCGPDIILWGRPRWQRP